MLNINCYEDGLNILIASIKNQMHQTIRKNKFQISEIRKNYGAEIRSNLLSARSNMRNCIGNQSTYNCCSRLLESRRRYSLLPLKSNNFRSPQKEKAKLKTRVSNKEKLMKQKFEIRAWTIPDTNQTDQS
ncbi:unnamed protein product (macronuclear) [Paramecium tetraurelia]|uniref:Uncharacterized protein n=1 Tax=Paramecium tetraurelia TaxID=5888 RepID=A0CJ30_PARTE|nr:uncharacterized protein GSPATT00007932001 [Paramecium tetraurelia]CAK70797.1 unnamed protein product [Paramecium tetraurelia]|eukprot:XP_001438194.1 hypothetical protein (macronuclear) [Paramecium tetraurelia strain d4-2]